MNVLSVKLFHASAFPLFIQYCLFMLAWNINKPIADVGQFLGLFDRGGVSEAECPDLDFAAARVLNKEGASRFVHERSVIAALNDRLAGLIDVVRHI